MCNDNSEMKEIKDRINKVERKLDKHDPIWIKFITPAVIAIIGIFSSIFLYILESRDMNLRLYSELVSKREEGENNLRIEMFSNIMNSILVSDSDQGKGDYEDEDTSSVISEEMEIRSVQLGLLARNFHETMDIKPIFEKVQSLVRNRANSVFKEIIDFKKDIISKCSANKPERGFYKDQNFHSTIDSLKKSGNDTIKIEHYRTLMRKKIRIKQYLDKLNSIASRMKERQTNILKSVGKQFRIQSEIPQGNDIFKFWDDSLWESDTGRITTFQCTLNLDQSKSSERIFEISVSRICSRFSKARIFLRAWRNERDLNDSSNTYQLCQYIIPSGNDKAILTGSDISVRDKADNFEGYSYTRIPVDSISKRFTLEHFDFPLVDNIHLSDNERCALVLNKIQKNYVDISLFYFPAKYAAIKDKTFYNVRALGNLAKNIDFLNEKK